MGGTSDANIAASVKEWRVVLNCSGSFGPRLCDEMADQACGVPETLHLRIATDHGSAAGLIRAGWSANSLVDGRRAGAGARLKSFRTWLGEGDGVSKSRLDHELVVCAADGCPKAASIIHSDVPYCGKHALEAWQREEDEFQSNKNARTRLSTCA